jgi:hypothetical protein
MGRLEMKTYFKAFMLAFWKLMFPFTNGAPAMTSENDGLIGLCKRIPLSQTLLVTTVLLFSQL